MNPESLESSDHYAIEDTLAHLLPDTKKTIGNLFDKPDIFVCQILTFMDIKRRNELQDFGIVEVKDELTDELGFTRFGYEVAFRALQLLADKDR